MNESLPQTRLASRLLMAALFGLVAVPACAQSGLGLFGSTHIGGGGQLYSAYPAILLGTTTTERAAPYGLLALSTAAFYNAGTTAFIDGYVRVTATDTAVFPVGNAGVFAPVTIATDAPGTFDAAYTSGSFNAGTFDSVSLEAVSATEYWDILGATSATVTLTWQSTSNITAITDDLTRLTLAGWNGTQWVALPGTLSDGATTTAGSLTTTTAADLNTYSAFTFARTYIPVSGTATVQAAKAYVYLKNGILSLDSQKTVAAVALYDLTGKLVQSYTVNNTAFSGNFTHATGVYLAKVQFTDGTALTRKLANY